MTKIVKKIKKIKNGQKDVMIKIGKKDQLIKSGQIERSK